MQTGHVWKEKKEKENQQKQNKKLTCKQPKIANKQQQETMFAWFFLYFYIFLNAYIFKYFFKEKRSKSLLFLLASCFWLYSSTPYLLK